MLGHVALKILDELTLARMVLSGEIEIEKMLPVPGADSESDQRRLVALSLINHLSYLLIDVVNMAEESDRAIYGLVEGLNASGRLPVTEEKRIFGFAAARQPRFYFNWQADQ